MKIKLAILEADKIYSKRISEVFSLKYSKKLEVYSFTNEEIALNNLESDRIDMLICSDNFEIDKSKLPKRCVLAYFVASRDIEKLYGEPAIFKFQKVDLIYNQILSVYLENEPIMETKSGDANTKVIMFTSVHGGVGASSMAVACALNFANTYKTLYLNLESFGEADLYLTGTGTFDMSDVVFAIKSGKGNLSAKLDSYVKCNENGVFFYSKPKIALDILELTGEEIITLMNTLKSKYDYIIVDMNFSFQKSFLEICQTMDSVIWISDGSEVSNAKVFNAYKAVETLEQNETMQLLDKLYLAYNKFSSKTGKIIKNIDIESIGGINKYEYNTELQLVQTLSKKSIFRKIIDKGV